MSGLTGKKNSTLKKESVKENKLLSVGVKSIKFWHEASAGETSIPFGSLVLPSSILTQGLSNPSSTELLSANLAFFHTNVEVFSSLNSKLMEGLSYVVKNSQITFINGYEAVAGEIFEVNFKNDVITGTNVVDARPLTATGVLLATETDFNVGEAFKTNQNPVTQLGDVLVFKDGLIQYRNVGNATASPAADGNYEEVHAGGGLGVIIRFNEAEAINTNIIVVSRNLIAERPTTSMMQFLESLGGQLDSVITTVADLAGVPESDFQVAPNQIDLRAFGDLVGKILNVSVPVNFINSFTLAGNDGRVITTTTEEIFFSGTGTGWVSSGDNNYYIVQKNDSCVDIKVSAAFVADAQRRLVLYKNGVFYRYIGNQSNANINYVQASFKSSIGEFAEGDQLSIRENQTGGTLNNDSTAHFMNINESQIVNTKIKDLV